MEPAKAQRSMTFTGCWTCKKRKVKCDERPSSCGNCLKIKVPCGGYGIRLQWINISNPFRELNKAQRTNSSGGGRIKIDRDTGPTYRTQEIDKFLETLDVAAGSGCSMREGPFTVFPTLQTDAENGDTNKESFKSKPPGQASTSRGFQHADDSSSMAQSDVFTSHDVPELPSDNNNRLPLE
nr:uncharacterized protein CTRU02_02152 [Colletotrichum truncatum]KAF6799281.1 hypothetical protein CTRU02_02152 [Colletotrichum truncatum]